MNRLILWEEQKTKVCDYYMCKGMNGKQYPDCRTYHYCHLTDDIQPLLTFLSEDKNKEEK